MIYKKYANVTSRLIYADGHVTPEDYERFEQEITVLPAQVANYWRAVLNQGPLIRFKVNMTRVLDCLLEHPVNTVIPEGVSRHELQLLEALMESAVSLSSKAVGHELLNIRERQMFVDHFRGVLNAYRSKGGASDGEEKAGA